MKILLGEGSPTMCDMQLRCFAKCGIAFENIVVVKCGEELLTVLEPNQFGLVLMAWQLPVPGATELVQQIRAIDCNVPIIGLMTHLEKMRQQELSACGMSDVLVKPYPSVELRTMLKKWSPAAAGV